MERESRRPSIVVIDNSELVLAVTRSELESVGYRVVTHPRAAGAVALILQEKPDLVLLEVSTGGDSVAKLFGKAQPNGSTIVLLYSALSAEALAAKVAACGAHGYIRKTPDGLDFLRQIKAWVQKSPASSGRMKAAPRFDADDDRSLRPSGNRLPLGGATSGAWRAAAPNSNSNLNSNSDPKSNPNPNSIYSPNSNSNSNSGPNSSSSTSSSSSSNASGTSGAWRAADLNSNTSPSPNASRNASGTSGAWRAAESHPSAASDPPRASGTMLIDERVVLFIDDDMETLSTFRREVQRESYTAEFALSGNRGLNRILSSAPPDLVLCDLTLQDMDGPAVYRAALASDPRWRTRFIFLSDTFVRRSKLELLGFDGVVLEKPFSGQTLRAAIQRALAVGETLTASGAG